MGWLKETWDSAREHTSALDLILPGSTRQVELADELVGYSAGKEAEAAARDLAASNARFIGLEAAEMERRQTEQFKADLSGVKGAIGASGIIADTGTSKLFLEEMTKSFQKEMDWSKVATESRQEIAIKGGGIAAQQIEQQTKQNIVGTGFALTGFLL